MKNIALLLTGCVNPDGMCKTLLQDPIIRQKQYINSLQWYLTNTNYPIIFVENSNTDFSNLFSIHIKNHRLEYLTFNGNNYDKSLGKGYGEMQILLYAIQKSMFLSKCDYFVKITGRVIIHNITTVINSIYGMKTNHFRCIFGTEHCISSMMFAATSHSLTLILEKKFDDINDSNNRFFEYCLFDSLCINKSIIVKPIFQSPIIEGETGSCRVNYGNIPNIDNNYRNLRMCFHLYRESKRYFVSFYYFILFRLYKHFYFDIIKKNSR